MANCAEVEVTLAQLPVDVELEADGALEHLSADGTVDDSGLLRAVQPVLRLDQAGPLPLASHGSTTAAALSAAEALLLCPPVGGPARFPS